MQGRKRKPQSRLKQQVQRIRAISKTRAGRALRRLSGDGIILFATAVHMKMISFQPSSGGAGGNGPDPGWGSNREKNGEAAFCTRARRHRRAHTCQDRGCVRSETRGNRSFQYLSPGLKATEILLSFSQALFLFMQNGDFRPRRLVWAPRAPGLGDGKPAWEGTESARSHETRRYCLSFSETALRFLSTPFRGAAVSLLETGRPWRP